MDKNPRFKWPLHWLKSLLLLALMLSTVDSLRSYSLNQPGFYGYLALLLALLSTLLRPTEFNLSYSAFVRQPIDWGSAAGFLLISALCSVAIAVVLL